MYQKPERDLHFCLLWSRTSFWFLKLSCPGLVCLPAWSLHLSAVSPGWIFGAKVIYTELLIHRYVSVELIILTSLATYPLGLFYVYHCIQIPENCLSLVEWLQQVLFSASHSSCCPKGGVHVCVCVLKLICRLVCRSAEDCVKMHVFLLCWQIVFSRWNRPCSNLSSSSVSQERSALCGDLYISTTAH